MIFPIGNIILVKWQVLGLSPFMLTLKMRLNLVVKWDLSLNVKFYFFGNRIDLYAICGIKFN